jgi:hypothetical protein
MRPQALAQFRRLQRWCTVVVTAATLAYGYWFAYLLVRYTAGSVQLTTTDMAFYIAGLVILTITAQNANRSTTRQ